MTPPARPLAALAAAAILVAASPIGVPAVPGARPTPYWASIAAGEARMRTGPGRQYPASWLYRRAGLPVQVIEVYPGWRKVRDPDGAEGWMIANLLSAQRAAIVQGATVALRDAPNPGARGGLAGRARRVGPHLRLHGRLVPPRRHRPRRLRRDRPSLGRRPARDGRVT